jgi:Nucleotide modification associated domain 2
MKLCSYVIVHDGGFAPNPFGRHCTLAACTPNHMGLRLQPGDWLMGNSNIDRGQKLVYAMRVSEVLDFDDYYRDPRFDYKKPRFDRTWREQCGDNIYYRDPNGDWAQAPSVFHVRPGDLEKDTRRPRVFISDHFFYFGENAQPIPAEFTALIRARQGCGCNFSPNLVEGFVQWLEGTFAPGVHGEPADRREASPAPNLVPLTQAGGGRTRHGPKKDCEPDRDEGC